MLPLADAAKILELSYRQTKRLWKRYRGEGAKGLLHRSPGRGSNRAKPEEFRRKVLQLIRKKYGNGAGAIWSDAGSGALNGLLQFYPTLATTQRGEYPTE